MRMSGIQIGSFAAALVVVLACGSAWGQSSTPVPEGSPALELPPSNRPAITHGDAAVFVDISADAGVAVTHRAVEGVMRLGIGTGAAWFDFDRDGDLDLYVTQGQGANHLFRNDDGVFTDVATEMGADDSGHSGSAVAVADYDNDGWLDIYLANADGDVLLRNDGGRRFVDVSEAVGIAGITNERATGAAWGDYDGDGYLDLYVVSHVNLLGLTYSSRDRLFHNEGGEAFTDVSHLLSSDLLNAYGFAATWTDFDGDGDVDLLVVNDCPFGYASRYRPTVLYRNDGGGHPHEWTFSEVSAEVGASHCRHGMGLAAGDYNRDGTIDYFYTNIGKRTTLLKNESGVFEDVAEEAGVLVGYNPREPGGPFDGTYSWGAGFIDYDLDGWLDLYVTAGTLLLTTSPDIDPQPNVLFRNRGDGTFEEIADAGGAQSTGRSRTTAVGDFDGDGDPDLLLVDAGQRVYLFRNDGANGRYLIVDLVGTVSNRDGIGAKVSVMTPDGSRQHVEIRSGSSLGGTDDLAAYFGLGSQTHVDELRVEWPSGSVLTMHDVAADQRITVTEAAETAHEETRAAADEDIDMSIYPNPARPPVSIHLAGPHTGSWHIEVHDASGRILRRLTASGDTATWDGRSDSGGAAPSGVYFIRARVGSRFVTRPIVLAH